MTEQTQSDEYSFRLFDFVINDPEVKVDTSESEDSSDDGDYGSDEVKPRKKNTDSRQFSIQMFGRLWVKKIKKMRKRKFLKVSLLIMI